MRIVYLVELVRDLLILGLLALVFVAVVNLIAADGESRSSYRGALWAIAAAVSLTGGAAVLTLRLRDRRP